MKINAEWGSYDEMYSYCLQIVGNGPAGKPAPTPGKTETGKVKELPAADPKPATESAKPAETKAVEAGKPGEKTTLDLIKEAGVRLSEKRMDGVRKLLTKFKVAKFSELKPEEQPKFLDHITKMENADDAKYTAMLTSLSK